MVLLLRFVDFLFGCLLMEFVRFSCFLRVYPIPDSAMSTRNLTQAIAELQFAFVETVSGLLCWLFVSFPSSSFHFLCVSISAGHRKWTFTCLIDHSYIVDSSLPFVLAGGGFVVTVLLVVSIIIAHYLLWQRTQIETAQHASSVKSDFVGFLLHELRNRKNLLFCFASRSLVAQ